MQTELSQLESDITNKESELQTLLPQYQQQRDQEERLTARLKACEQRRSELFAKQGRVQQFSTRQDRDKWINKEITSLQQSAAQKEHQVSLYSCSTCIYVYTDLHVHVHVHVSIYRHVHFICISTSVIVYTHLYL